MSSSVRIEVLTPARYRENYEIEHAFLGSKKFCCVLPWSCCGFGEWRAQREKQAPEHKALYAVAIDESTDKVLGFVYCCGHGMKCDLHTPKAGELYVEVDRGERRRAGQGRRHEVILTRATQAQAVARGDTVMSLAVLRGNRAQGLCTNGSPSRSNPTRTAATSAASAASPDGICFGRPLTAAATRAGAARS